MCSYNISLYSVFSYGNCRYTDNEKVVRVRKINGCDKDQCTIGTEFGNKRQFHCVNLIRTGTYLSVNSLVVLI